MQKRTIVAGLLLLCAALAGLRWIRAERAVEPKADGAPRPAAPTRVEAEAEAAGGGGVAARAIDPATRAYKGGWFVGDGQQVAELADESKEIFLMSLENPGRGLEDIERWMTGMTGDQMLKTYDCERLHLRSLTNDCSFRLRMVIKRTDESSGKVVFVKPTSDAPLDEQCKAYSDCLAHSAYLGGDVPFAAGNGDALAVHTDARMLASSGTKEEYQAYLGGALKEMREDLAKMLENPDSEPREIERQEHLIKFFELRQEKPQ